MKEKLEEARVVVRSIREDIRHEVQKLEKEINDALEGKVTLVW